MVKIGKNLLSLWVTSGLYNFWQFDANLATMCALSQSNHTCGSQELTRTASLRRYLLSRTLVTSVPKWSTCSPMPLEASRGYGSAIDMPLNVNTCYTSDTYLWQVASTFSQLCTLISAYQHADPSASGKEKVRFSGES